MKRRLSIPLALMVGICSGLSPAYAQHEHEPKAGDPSKLGTVNFQTSCEPKVQQQFASAMAMLHSFWYEKASDAFAAIAKEDPKCGIAYWGLAMTDYHQLWSPPPGPTDLKAGLAAIEKAKLAGAGTQRERDYISALETFYTNWDKIDHRTRALAYERTMKELQQRYPNDHEASIFYALALVSTVLPTDKTYANQKAAGAILEPLFVAEPQHPGIAHYIIHAYDYPPLAPRALDAARRYAAIAPDSPHALHMPSHIFTRLGLWQESIKSNLASAASAQRNDAPGNELHAKDYLIYAYLQGAQDQEAKRALEGVPAGRPDDPQYTNWLYAMGTSPARFAVERHRWDEAAALTVPTNIFPGGRWAWTEANLHFARALGALHTKQIGVAQQELQKLQSLRNTLVQVGDVYWADQLAIQTEIVTAWISFAQGKRELAAQQMRSAADHEDKTDKNNVTPGVLLPARELLGDMLVDLNQPGEATLEYETVLRTAPNRYNALAGAARAAKLSGNADKAKTYYAKLLSICAYADGDRPELRDAHMTLASK